MDTHVHVGLPYWATVEELIERMNKMGIDKAVLVQYISGMPAGGNCDNTYLYSCMKQYPTRLAGCVIVDYTNKDAPKMLEWWAKNCGMQGVRIRTSTTSPGEDKLAIWRKADELHLNCSLLGDPTGANEIAKQFPNLNLLVEHLGMGLGNEQSGEEVLELAKCPNVYVKLTTLGQSRASKEEYPFKDTFPFIKRVFSAFGPQRIMWGSNFPATAYNLKRMVNEKFPGEDADDLRTLDYVRKEIKWLSGADKEWVLGKTALKVWTFKP